MVSLGPGTLPSPCCSVHKGADTAGPEIPVLKLVPCPRPVWDILSASVDKAPETRRVLGILRRREQKGRGMGGRALIYLHSRVVLSAALTYMSSAERGLNLGAIGFRIKGVPGTLLHLRCHSCCNGSRRSRAGIPDMLCASSATGRRRRRAAGPIGNCSFEQ